MPVLNIDARRTLRDAGIRIVDYVRSWSTDGRWHGDVCGCPDDRCIGHHHDADDECGCLRSIVDERKKNAPDADATAIEGNESTTKGEIMSIVNDCPDIPWSITEDDLDMVVGYGPGRARVKALRYLTSEDCWEIADQVEAETHAVWARHGHLLGPYENLQAAFRAGVYSSIQTMAETDEWARQAIAVVQAELSRVAKLPDFREWADREIAQGPWDEADCLHKWIEHTLELPKVPDWMHPALTEARYERAGRDEWWFRLTTPPLEHVTGQGSTVMISLDAMITVEEQSSGEFTVAYTPPRVSLYGDSIEELDARDAIAIAEMLRTAGEALAGEHALADL